MKIDSEVLKKILSVERFRDSIYRDLDISATLDFFRRRYVQPLALRFNISECTVVDCGAGYGWFSFAYIFAGGKQVIAVDLERERLDAAASVARILGVDHKIQFITSAIQEIDLPSNAAELFVSIETIEHVGQKNIRPALLRIKEIASRGIIITTPNKLFPVIAHDTRLPFVHWFSPSIRRSFTRLFKRGHLDFGNEFVSPFDLNVLLDKFYSDTTCLTFRNFGEYLAHFPVYLPYGRQESKRWLSKPSPLNAAYYRLASALFGSQCYWVMPSLTTLFVRR